MPQGFLCQSQLDLDEVMAQLTVCRTACMPRAHGAQSINEAAKPHHILSVCDQAPEPLANLGMRRCGPRRR